MKLLLKRDEFHDDCTIGQLFVDGEFECYTLEDVVRDGPKIPRETAIPTGTYEVILNESPRFKKILPRLVDVPGFTGILIHGGNGPEDTSGCILVGDEIVNGRIKGGTSTPAISRLMSAMLTVLLKNEEISIEIQEVRSAV